MDRLLANLATLGRPPEGDHTPPGKAPALHTSTQPRHHGVRPSPRAPTRGDLVALWARVLLGIAFGGLMTSWKLRNAAAHILSLILFFWGIVLAAEQVLPRIGYAAERASWRCPSAPSTAGPPRRAAAPASSTADAQLR